MTKSFKTFLKHTAKDYHNQSVNPPVVRASTIIFKSMQDIRKMQDKSKKDPTGGHFDYGRQGTSTTHILQQILSKLEESYFTFLTPTGFGAVFLAIFNFIYSFFLVKNLNFLQILGALFYVIIAWGIHKRSRSAASLGLGIYFLERIIIWFNSDFKMSMMGLSIIFFTTVSNVLSSNKLVIK